MSSGSSSGDEEQGAGSTGDSSDQGEERGSGQAAALRNGQPAKDKKGACGQDNMQSKGGSNGELQRMQPGIPAPQATTNQVVFISKAANCVPDLNMLEFSRLTGRTCESEDPRSLSLAHSSDSPRSKPKKVSAEEMLPVFNAWLQKCGYEGLALTDPSLNLALQSSEDRIQFKEPQPHLNKGVVALPREVLEETSIANIII